MKAIISAAIALCACVLASPAHAQRDITSGENWLRLCTSGQTADTVTCISYVMGIESGMQMQAAIDNTRLPYCPPATLTNGQKQDIFSRFLAAHPEARTQNAAMSYLVAMQQAFPCAK